FDDLQWLYDVAAAHKHARGGGCVGIPGRGAEGLGQCRHFGVPYATRTTTEADRRSEKPSAGQLESVRYRLERCHNEGHFPPAESQPVDTGRNRADPVLWSRLLPEPRWTDS